MPSPLEKYAIYITRGMLYVDIKDCEMAWPFKEEETFLLKALWSETETAKKKTTKVKNEIRSVTFVFIINMLVWFFFSYDSRKRQNICLSHLQLFLSLSFSPPHLHHTPFLPFFSNKICELESYCFICPALF